MKSTQLIILGLFVSFFSSSIYSQASISFATDLSKVYAFDPSKKVSKSSFEDEKIDYTDWRDLLEKNVSAKGKVNYEGIKADIEKFNNFLRTLSNTKINIRWSQADKMAYWMNLYNAYTIKLVLDHYPLNSIKEIKRPWKKEFFSVGGQIMSLSTIEKEILQEFNEPRIYFAMNTASVSGPKPTRAPFTSENIEILLEKKTKEFINDEFYNTINAYTANVSPIFGWYKREIRATYGSIENFINQYSEVVIKDQKDKGYKSYDWSLNNQNKI